MFRKLFKGLLCCVAMAACGDATPAPERHVPDEPHQNTDTQKHGGGNSGTEGSILPCEDKRTTLESDDTPSAAVGVSAASMLELANRQSRIVLGWPKLDAGPTYDATAREATLHITATGPAVEIACNDPNYPAKYRTKPRVELPVEVVLRTENGALDERIEGVLMKSEDPERAYIDADIGLQAEELGGSVARAIEAFYAVGDREVTFEFSFGPEGARGWLGGPFSPHKAGPCAFTAYVHWPADVACWPLRAGNPSDDTAAMNQHLERLNRSFELQWSDRPGEPTSARIEARLAEGVTCRDEADQVSHPVEVRIVSDDGRIDFTAPAELSGGPSTIDPWPANLRDVEPFSLHLMGSIAVDSNTLREQLGYDEPNVSAAIVNFYVSSPSGVASPELSGMVRVTPIDRSGFDSPLPTVQLPGGDSERCFSSGRVVRRSGRPTSPRTDSERRNAVRFRRLADDFRGRYLEPGARVRLVAPASPFDSAEFERGVSRLRERYDVHYDPDILERKGYFAGDDARRLSELQAAIDDPKLDGIITARGGYGATRLLSRLDLDPLSVRPKLLVGYSDISALHAAWARSRLLSVHANMVAALGRCETAQVDRWFAAVEGTFPPAYTGLSRIAPGSAEGVLLGGNLTVLTALLATPHALPCANAVLFFEDIGERPYRIDRMLTTWRDAGAFGGVRGIVLGAFVQGDPGPDGVSAHDVLAERLGDLGVPVVAGLASGHLDDNAELPFGRRVQLEAARGELLVLPRRIA